MSDSDSDDDEAVDKSQGTFCFPQKYHKANIQEKTDDLDKLATRGNV